MIVKELEHGDEIGIRSPSGRWLPLRFDRFDERGRMHCLPVISLAPPICIWRASYGDGVLHWRHARDVEFQQPCPTCTLRISKRDKAAAIASDDHSWQRGPKGSKDCETCGARRWVPWAPFENQPVCYLVGAV